MREPRRVDWYTRPASRSARRRCRAPQPGEQNLWPRSHAGHTRSWTPHPTHDSNLQVSSAVKHAPRTVNFRTDDAAISDTGDRWRIFSARSAEGSGCNRGPSNTRPCDYRGAARPRATSRLPGPARISGGHPRSQPDTRASSAPLTATKGRACGNRARAEASSTACR